MCADSELLRSQSTSDPSQHGGCPTTQGGRLPAADFFSVQRSENGKAFQEIGRVKAAGNSTSSRKYGFIDATVDQRFRYFYYQLLVVDLDKKEEDYKNTNFKLNNKQVKEKQKLYRQLAKNKDFNVMYSIHKKYNETLIRIKNIFLITCV